MNEHQQNFDEVKRLLKLKRHEVPPPGYFDTFSDAVVSRIRTGESERSMTLAERLQSEASWLAAFLRIFETRPGAIGGFATGVCLLVVLGVVFAEYADRPQKNRGEISEVSGQSAGSMAALATPDAPTLLLGADSGGITVSTNPVIGLQPAPSIFGQPGVQNVSFTAGH